MSANERLKGLQVHRPIIYGSMARLLTDEEKATAPPGHTHRWTIFLTSAATPPPTKSATSSTDAAPVPVDKDYIPGGADDLSYVLKRIVFRLHETYPNPNRVCEKPPYKVTETGWGEFTVQMKMTFIPEAAEKALTLQHTIKLHHWGEPIEAQPVEATPSGTPAAEKTEEPKTEPETPAETQATEVSAADVSASQTPGEALETPAGDAPMAAPPPLPTVASTYPVHAWQYDEIVFSDPPQNFMNILEANPPTPLPPRSRRPRDQREENEIKTGVKKKRGGARPSVSRAGTEALNTSRAGTPASVVGTPTVGMPGQPLQVGVPGEMGSADVPLEFTAEMEKGEFNKLTETRIRIVQEMDRWRERLIAQEKELVRLKEEMKG